MIARVSDWDARLSAYIAERFGTIELVYGKTDCALFCADAVLAMTGTDIAAAYRGKYRSAAGSIRALKLYGAVTLEATTSSVLPPKPVGYARRGDVVMFDGAVGICIGADALFVPAEGVGLHRIERARWAHAWSVG